MSSIFDQDLPRNEANFAALSPLSFIERSAEVYPQRLAVVQMQDLHRQDGAVGAERGLPGMAASALELEGAGSAEERAAEGAGRG